MTKVKDTGTDSVASTLTSLANQYTSPSLDEAERRKLQYRNTKAPDELVEMMCHLAEQNGGEIAGMSFDAATARAVLTATSTARTRISAARTLLRRMEDDMVQQRVTVSDPTFAIFSALRRLVLTKAGNALAPAYAQMKALVKVPRKSRAKTATEDASTQAPQASAPVTPAASTKTAAPAAVVSPAN